MSSRDAATTPCEYGCADGYLYDPRVQGNVVECPCCKGDATHHDAPASDAATTPACDLCGATSDLERIEGYAGVRGANLTVCRNRWSCIDRQLKREAEEHAAAS